MEETMGSQKGSTANGGDQFFALYYIRGKVCEGVVSAVPVVAPVGFHLCDDFFKLVVPDPIVNAGGLSPGSSGVAEPPSLPKRSLDGGQLLSAHLKAMAAGMQKDDTTMCQLILPPVPSGCSGTLSTCAGEGNWMHQTKIPRKAWAAGDTGITKKENHKQQQKAIQFPGDHAPHFTLPHSKLTSFPDPHKEVIVSEHAHAPGVQCTTFKNVSSVAASPQKKPPQQTVRSTGCTPQAKSMTLGHQQVIDTVNTTIYNPYASAQSPHKEPQQQAMATDSRIQQAKPMTLKPKPVDYTEGLSDDQLLAGLAELEAKGTAETYDSKPAAKKMKPAKTGSARWSVAKKVTQFSVHEPGCTIQGTDQVFYWKCGACDEVQPINTHVGKITEVGCAACHEMNTVFAYIDHLEHLTTSSELCYTGC